MNKVNVKKALTVLIVDDEILIARNLQSTLIDLGHEVPEVVCTGEDAIDRVEKIKPDLVFMDIRLASGMDGIESAQIIKDRFAIPVVFLTAYADDETLARARKVGPYGYLVKPIAERDIKIVIEMALGRHEAELLLETSERRNKLILDTAYDAFIGMNEEGLITEWNPQAELTFGWSRTEVIGRPLREIIIPQQFREAHSRGLENFLKTGHGLVLNKRLEMSALHQDGHEFPVELTISCIRSNGHYLFSAFVHDITDRKGAEAALQKAHDTLEDQVKERTAELEEANSRLIASNAELEQFAAVAAHDLRSPIRAMMNWIDMLEFAIAKPRDPEIEQAIEFIRANSKKADQLINDLLEVARANKASARIERVDLNRVVQNVLATLKENIEKTCAELYVQNLPIVFGNSTYLEAIFRNLVQNALNYRHKDRSPKISIGSKAVPESDYFEFFVQDNGIGIAKEYTGRIFEMFKRLNSESDYPGTGIGLAFCKKAIESYGGKIWVDSTPDVGSTFFYTFPKSWGGGVENEA